VIATSQTLEVRRAATPGNGGDLPRTRDVLGWELRRRVSSRRSWVLLACVALFFAVYLVLTAPLGITPTGQPIPDPETSPHGMLHEVVVVVLPLFGMLLPFLAADGVARDARQRVHELLMATRVSSRAYVSGRYLAVLLLGLVLSVELLVVIWAVDVMLHATRSGYPAPQFGPLVTIWVLTVLPAMVLLLSLSFALGTLWPRLSNLLKLAVLLGWIGLYVVGAEQILGHLPGWAQRLDPTSYLLYAAGQSRAVPGATPDPTRLPALQPWVLPHVGLVVLGVALAVAAVAGFRRFRDVLA